MHRGMKRILLMLLTAGFISPVFAQEENQKTCFQQYQAIFKKRGAQGVGDGMHREVVVSVTDDYGTACYYGKARVEGGQVTSIFIKFMDGEYELFESKDFKGGPGATISNGISEAWITKKDGRTMRVIFIKKINPKKKKYQTAPPPDPDKL